MVRFAIGCWLSLFFVYKMHIFYVPLHLRKSFCSMCSTQVSHANPQQNSLSDNALLSVSLNSVCPRMSLPHLSPLSLALTCAVDTSPSWSVQVSRAASSPLLSPPPPPTCLHHVLACCWQRADQWWAFKLELLIHIKTNTTSVCQRCSVSLGG